jgi:hypothetical protein
VERGVPLFDEVRKMVAIVAARLITQSLKIIEGIDDAYLYALFLGNSRKRPAQ